MLLAHQKKSHRHCPKRKTTTGSRRSQSTAQKGVKRNESPETDGAHRLLAEVSLLEAGCACAMSLRASSAKPGRWSAAAAAAQIAWALSLCIG